MTLELVYPHTGQTCRMIGTAEVPEWVAKDVCDVLGLSNITEAMNGIPEDDLSSVILKSGGQDREFRTLTEAGLYRLIFKSRKLEAERFKTWVVSEVLPSIRKTGRYSLGSQVDERFALIEPFKALQDQVSAIASDVRRLVAFQNKERRPLPDHVKRFHVQRIADSVLRGRCPCCEEVDVVANGQVVGGAQYDHYYQPHLSDERHTWLICRVCHDGFTYGRVDRRDRRDEWEMYQRRVCKFHDGQFKQQRLLA